MDIKIKLSKNRKNRQLALFDSHFFLLHRISKAFFFSCCFFVLSCILILKVSMIGFVCLFVLEEAKVQVNVSV